MGKRSIFHCDCDSFFASVEETFHPEYRDVPMAVAGDPNARHGIILAKNQKAKLLGIKTAETIWSAKQKCPELLLAPPRYGTYEEFCERFNAIYEDYTDQVERFGIDESYLDVTGSLHFYSNNPYKLAEEIQARVKRELDITVSIGISWNKIFAKLGSDQKKPNGIFVINKLNYKKIVWPMNVSEMIFIGRNTVKGLQKLAIYTLGDLANADKDLLIRIFGKRGELMHAHANGLDTEPVKTVDDKRQVKSVGNGMTFKRDLVSSDDIHLGVLTLADSVATRLRRKGLKASTLQVSVKDTFLKSIQKQVALPHPTNLALDISNAAISLIESFWQKGKPIRLITLTAQQLSTTGQVPQQLSLFDTDEKEIEREEDLEMAMDKIRHRFGRHSIQSSAIVGNDLGISEDGHKK